MKIKNFSLVRLRNEEHFQFFTSFRNLVLAITAIGLKIETLFNLFLEALNNELLALDVVRGNSISDDLEDADADRDSVFRGMCDAVKSAHNHFNPEIREAAKRLQMVLDTYGNLAIKPYEAETGGLNGLINEFNTNCFSDASLVGIADWIRELAVKNKAFDDLKNARYTSEISKTILRMKQERKKTDEIYHQIVERINALIVVEGEAAAYVGFVNELNKRIEEYDNTIALRRAKGKKAGETPAAK